MTLLKTFLTLLVLSVSINTHAQERIALVIGNADYQTSPLNNSVNDAQDIASTLKELDFKVTLVTDGNKQTMESAIVKFGDKLNKDTVGLFYYSGHAVQYKGSNYLVPIGSVAQVNKVEDLPSSTVAANLILDKLEGSFSKLNFVFLDSCRDNPFANLSNQITPGLAKTEGVSDSGALGMPSLAKGMFTSRGITKETVKPKKDTTGTLVAYSTMPGKVAADGSGRNSPYTKHLLERIKEPNALVQIMLSDVMSAVEKETNGKQIPIYEAAISGRFCFKTVDDQCGKTVNIYSSFLEGVEGVQSLVLENDGVKLNYRGQVKDGKAYGKGIGVIEDGSKYEGEFKNSKFHGKGVITYASGSRYEGDIKKGKRHGEGRYTSANGYHYEGDFKDGLFHGKGAYFSVADGDRYNGDWKDGRQHGKGVYTWVNDGQSYYKGEWENGVPHGKGIYVYPTGARHEGEFKDGLEHGKGVLNYTNGDVFEGRWEKGKLIIISKVSKHHSNGNRYKGEAKPIHDGEGYQMHGYGIFFEKDGSFHKGEWKNDKKHGKGVKVDIGNDKAATSIFTGTYKDGKKDSGRLLIIANTKSGDTGIINIFFKNGKQTSTMFSSLTNPNVRTVMGLAIEGNKRIYYDKVRATIKDGSKFTGSLSFSVNADESLNNNASGLMIYENGAKYKGDFIFNDGVWSRTGHGVYTDIDGVQQKQEWNNGKEIL